MLNKKLVFGCALLIGLCSGVHMAFAQTPDLSTVSILTEEYPPYNFKNDQGEVDGINTQKVKAALKKLNLNIPLQIQPWARAYETTKEGENVFLYTCSRTPQREDEFKWVTVLSKSDVSVYALKSKAVKINSLEDLRKHKMSGVRGYRYLPFLAEKGFTEDGGNLDLTSSDETNLKKLMTDRVDMMISNSDQIAFLAKKTNVDLSNLEKVYEFEPLLTEGYLVTGKNTSDAVVAEIRKGFQ